MASTNKASNEITSSPGLPQSSESTLTQVNSETTNSTYTPDDFNVLLTKVEKLEGLLSKCRGTIVLNKEKVKQLNEDKEGIQCKFETQLEQMRNKYETEMNSKFEGLQEQIESLTETKVDLEKQLNDLMTLGKDECLKNMKKNLEEEKVKNKKLVGDLKKEIENLKKSSDLPKSSDKGVVVSSEEHKKIMKLLECRSEELIGVMEERSSLRKELNSQRERFALVLERYDEQMKVVQEELKKRMMPGPEEASMGKQVKKMMDEINAGEVKVKGKGGENEGKKGKGKNLSVEKQLENSQDKVIKLLDLLEKCAKKADDKEAECGRWNERFVELNEQSKKEKQQNEETISRLNSQLENLSTRENQLNESLERTRTENVEMLTQQRTEIQNLQKMVEKLVQNEAQLKKQLEDTKVQCDKEVERATEENQKSMNGLMENLKENKCILTDLFKQLQESKENSSQMINDLETELEYRIRQLDAARTYIKETEEKKPHALQVEAIFNNMPNIIYVDEHGNPETEIKKETDSTVNKTNDSSAPSSEKTSKKLTNGKEKKIKQ